MEDMGDLEIIEIKMIKTRYIFIINFSIKYHFQSEHIGNMDKLLQKTLIKIKLKKYYYIYCNKYNDIYNQFKFKIKRYCRLIKISIRWSLQKRYNIQSK